MLWFVAPREAIGRGAVTESVEDGRQTEERGDPGSLDLKKKKNKRTIRAHFIPSSTLKKLSGLSQEHFHWDISLDIGPKLCVICTVEYARRKGDCY